MGLRRSVFVRTAEMDERERDGVDKKGTKRDGSSEK